MTLNILWLVVKDLVDFVMSFTHVSTPTLNFNASTPLLIKAPVAPLQIVSAHSVPPINLLPAHANSTKPILITYKTEVVENTDILKTTVGSMPAIMYVSNPGGANCTVGPQLEFDCVIDTLDFGSAVTVVRYDGRYAYINRPNISGYVLKEDLTPVKNNAWPIFLNKNHYYFDNSETIKTRFLIKDIFTADNLSLPLQAGEYVTARLLSEHRVIPWTKVRPRLAGLWQNLLKGVSGIHITVNPKTDSVMEWKNDIGEGRLAYVEGVAPDKTITLTAIGVEKEGEYSIFSLNESAWRELRPVFIEVA